MERGEPRERRESEQGVLLEGGLRVPGPRNARMAGLWDLLLEWW